MTGVGRLDHVGFQFEFQTLSPTPGYGTVCPKPPQTDPLRLFRIIENV